MEGLAPPHCVASSSQPERIRLSLARDGARSLRAEHLQRQLVERGKPAPDLFLHASAKMGYRPSDCIVIEDSPAGIEAAKSAGMRVFAFAGAATHATTATGGRSPASNPTCCLTTWAN